MESKRKLVCATVAAALACAPAYTDAIDQRIARDLFATELATSSDYRYLDLARERDRHRQILEIDYGVTDTFEVNLR